MHKCLANSNLCQEDSLETGDCSLLYLVESAPPRHPPSSPARQVGFQLLGRDVLLEIKIYSQPDVTFGRLSAVANFSLSALKSPFHFVHCFHTCGSSITGQHATAVFNQFQISGILRLFDATLCYSFSLPGQR
jgi:hypothetical protein